MARCGTTSGYTSHQHKGEKPCDACATAKREYDQRWRSADETRRRSRLSAKAQAEAYKVLADRYPLEYQRAYLSARAALFDAAGLDWCHR